MVTKNQKTATGLVPLSDITSLNDLRQRGINIHPDATRPIDAAHVRHISNADFNTVPPVDIVDFNGELVMIDGYHRQHARLRKALLEHLSSTTFPAILDFTEQEQDDAIENMTEDTHNAVCTETLLRANIVPFVSWVEVNKQALLANNTHGLGAKSPVHKALAYYEITREEENAPSQSKVAELFGISRAALNEYVMKQKREQEEEQAETETEEDAAREEEEEVKKAIKKFNKAIESIMDFVNLYPEQAREQSGSLSLAYVRSYMILFGDIQEKEKEKELANTLATLFTGSPFTNKDVFDMENVGQKFWQIAGKMKKMVAARDKLIQAEKEQAEKAKQAEKTAKTGRKGKADTTTYTQTSMENQEPGQAPNQEPETDAARTETEQAPVN